MLDLVYTTIPGAYSAEPCPHLGYSDHISDIQTACQTLMTS